MMNDHANRRERSGRYLRQPSGYRAFIPSPLPPDPPIAIDTTLQTLLSTADYALGRLDGAVLTLPNPDLFVFMYVRKEAVLSSQIEGTQSSLQQLLAAEVRLNDPDTPADVSEVVNYVAAMNHGLARLEKLPVSLRKVVTERFRIGKMGVFGATFRPGHYGGFIALVNQSGVDRSGTIWKSVGQRGAREAARALLSELSESLGNVLFLDRPLRRSFRLFERSRAGTVWVLLEPTEEEIHMLSSRIIRRLGLR